MRAFRRFPNRPDQYQESTLANTVQARKRARQAEKHRKLNASQRSSVRTQIRNVMVAVASGDKAKATEAFRKAVPVIDRMSQKGIVAKNTAARQKSRLNKLIRALG
jgi:small subunit ribosomal protein S20